MGDRCNNNKIHGQILNMFDMESRSTIPRVGPLYREMADDFGELADAHIPTVPSAL